MRITSTQIGRTLVHNLERAARRMQVAQDQLATLRRLQTPRDDPGGTAAALQLRRVLAEGQRHATNTDDGLAWLQATDSALEQLTAILNRAREIAVSGANTAHPQQSLDAFAAEVDQLLASAVGVANSTHDGRYLFGGFKTAAQPFTQVGPTVTYNGDANAIEREIGPNERVAVNVPGTALLPPAPAPNLFGTLAALANDLRTGAQATIGSTRIGELDGHIDGVLGLRADVGAKVGRFERNAALMRDGEVAAKNLLSRIEDADVAKVIVDLKLAEAAHSSALAAGARMVPLTLVDFLR